MLFLALALAFRLTDTTGIQRSEADLSGVKAGVFVFLAPQCPLSTAVLPDLREAANRYASRGVRFFAVNARRPVPFPDLIDPGQTLARRLDAAVTPQVVIVSGAGAILYSGRIDDRAVTLGRTRPQPTRSHLVLAIEEILAGKPVTVPRTRATGCAIEFPAVQRKGTPVWATDIAPILYRHCVECHRPGQPAPFSLLHHADAAARASTIAQVVEQRLMPPWLPSPNPQHPFLQERRLKNEEIRIIRQWARGGAPPGDLRSAPPAPPEPPQWPLGPPDAVVELADPFPIPAGGADLYQCLVIPRPLDRDRFVRAYDFRAGPGTHHALLFLDSIQAARRRDAESPGPGYPCFGVPGFLPSASLGGWAPGSASLAYPAGAAVRFRSTADLVLQLHFQPFGRAELSRPKVALYFQENAPARRMMDVPLGSRQIDIPAGERRYIVRDHFTLPVNVEVTGIIPHAHFIARTMRGWAILPDGSRKELIHIPRWNFQWQLQYRYRKPFRLPADTRLEMEFVYDNSKANPQNPFSPPRRIRWGPDSTDEMAGLHVQVIPDSGEDASELGSYLWGKMMRERLVRPAPENQ
jgi:hypothetical protein